MARFNRRRFIQYGSLAAGTGVLAACGNTTEPDVAEPTAAAALQAVSFGTNWYAQAEHGGFYQAVAAGIYEEYGLDVTIQMGGPQVNGTQLLMGNAVDFFMGYASDAIEAVEEANPKVTVAAMFQ